MSGSIRRASISLPTKYADLRPTLDTLLRYLDQMDVRSEETRFAGGVKWDGERLLIGSSPNLARAVDQRVLPLVNASNKLSTQSAQPLTASESGGIATINIAAHTVQFGFGPVAYNAGSISGLALNTLYYVYADDPNYAGGAVTYFATTNPLTVTSGNGRYYLGKITTPSGGGGPTGGGWGGGGGGGGSQIP